MLRFFHQIRRSLIDTRSGKYFLYGIGEIALVVIGILIALQVNNWNESNQEKRIEKKVLNEILGDLDLSLRELNADLAGQRCFIHSTEQLMWDLINGKSIKEPFDRRIIDASRDNQFQVKKSGFENLKSIGLGIIRNDSLRLAITNLYQLDFHRLYERGQRQNTVENITALMKPHLEKYIGYDGSVVQPDTYDNDKVSVDLPALVIQNSHVIIEDEAYVKDLRLSLVWRLGMADRYIGTIERLKKVQDMIRSELKL